MHSCNHAGTLHHSTSYHAGRPLSSVASILPQGSLGPGLAIVAVVGGLLSWRSWVYFQRELFVASTIGRYVPKGAFLRARA